MKSPGFSIIEIIIAASIISIVGFSAISSARLFIKISANNSNNIQAAIILEETAEIIEFTRDQSWSENFQNLEMDKKYYLQAIQSGYKITTKQSGINKFDRSVSFSEIRRDASNQISNIGFTDPQTYLVDIIVSWQESQENKEINSKMLIHDIYDN